MEPNMLDPAVIADPRGSYARMRNAAPVQLGRMFDGTPAWYVTGAAEVRALLGDPRFVTSVRSLPAHLGRGSVPVMPGLPKDLDNPTIVDTDGPEHTRLRKLVSRAFTARRVAELRPRVVEIAEGLLSALDRTGPVDLLEEFAYPLPITVICELVGVPEHDRPSWRRWTRNMTSMDPTRLPGAITAVAESVRQLAAARRAEPEDDLVTALVQAHDDGDRLTEGELITMVVALVFAGHENTANLIGNAVVALLDRPELLARLQREPHRWPAAANELMRVWSPVQFVQVRYATEDIVLGGVTIAAGDSVLPVLISANSDPREHTDPDVVDPERTTPNLALGHGPHYCLGAALARQEVEVALTTLFERFPSLDMTAAPEWAPIPGALRLTHLPVAVGDDAMATHQR
ncbi:cytochrome P450 family protein [Pseudonocardia sp. TRM90224]|uniref:cytochrome P450 family protein n=1 Tax=Pseudonocardia sp. TRM90224 TaxID=2812678 RepID=UPI001E63883A|nr:cytochrome P450 [Pseudonocardia sp. TRM90224]